MPIVFLDVWEMIKDSHDEDVKYLISKRPLHALKCSFNRTLLFAAACYDKLDLAEFMLDHGFDIYATNERGWSVLHLAAYNDSIETVEFLCRKYPILMKIKCNEDNTPYDLAKRWEKHRSVGILNK